MPFSPPCCMLARYSSRLCLLTEVLSLSFADSWFVDLLLFTRPFPEMLIAGVLWVALSAPAPLFMPLIRGERRSAAGSECSVSKPFVCESSVESTTSAASIIVAVGWLGASESWASPGSRFLLCPRRPPMNEAELQLIRCLRTIDTFPSRIVDSILDV